MPRPTLRVRRPSLALLLPLLASPACESAAQRRGAELYPALCAQVEQAARSSDRRLDLRESRPGVDWDRLVVIPAYATADLASRKLGFRWNEVLRSASQMQDMYQLLVFAQGEQVVAWVDYEYRCGDLGALASRPAVPRHLALFEIHLEPDGRRRLLPAEGQRPD
jgi:hypothetical protein